MLNFYSFLWGTSCYINRGSNGNRAAEVYIWVFNIEILVLGNTEYPNPSSTKSSRHLQPGRIWQWAVIKSMFYLGAAPNTSEQDIQILQSVANSEVCFTYHPVYLVKQTDSLNIFQLRKSLQINFQNFNYSFDDIWWSIFNKILNATFLKLQRFSWKLEFLLVSQ